MARSATQPKKPIKSSEYSIIEYMSGRSRKGPKRCLHCRKAFRKGDTWQRVTSPNDPKFGTYMIGIHTNCM